MMKFIANTAVTLAKVYAVCALVNQLNYLSAKVSELEGEIEKLKSKG